MAAVRGKEVELSLETQTEEPAMACPGKEMLLCLPYQRPVESLPPGMSSPFYLADLHLHQMRIVWRSKGRRGARTSRSDRSRDPTRRALR